MGPPVFDGPSDLCLDGAHGRRWAVFVATVGHSWWPSTGTFVAARWQFLMATDTVLRERYVAVTPANSGPQNALLARSWERYAV
jgi:hypothetical protein